MGELSGSSWFFFQATQHNFAPQMARRTFQKQAKPEDVSGFGGLHGIFSCGATKGALQIPDEGSRERLTSGVDCWCGHEAQSLLRISRVMDAAAIIGDAMSRSTMIAAYASMSSAVVLESPHSKTIRAKMTVAVVHANQIPAIAIPAPVETGVDSLLTNGVFTKTPW